MVNTRASNHISHYLNIFCLKTKLQMPMTILLLDGSKRLVDIIGKITLPPYISLRNVLYIPDFKHNLLSISRLLTIHSLVVVFNKSSCVLKDSNTHEQLAIAQASWGLYVLDADQFRCNKSLLNSYCFYFNLFSCNE